MPEPAWIRARIPGVGTFSQREDVPLAEDAEVLDGVDGLGPDGRPLPDQPEQPLEEPETAAPPAQSGHSAKAATTPGDDKAGTTTGVTSTSKE